MRMKLRDVRTGSTLIQATVQKKNLNKDYRNCSSSILVQMDDTAYFMNTGKHMT